VVYARKGPGSRGYGAKEKGDQKVEKNWIHCVRLTTVPEDGDLENRFGPRTDNERGETRILHKKVVNEKAALLGSEPIGDQARWVVD